MESNFYETLLNEAARVSWCGSQEESDRLRPQRERLLQQLAQSPHEAIPVLLKALQESDLYRRTTAIEVIDSIDYPANEPAIPALIYQIEVEDPNSPTWSAAVIVLSHLGPDIVVPHLIRAFLEKGEPYHKLSISEYHTSWYKDIEGLTMLLTRTKLDSEYARRCCSAINYLLTQVVGDSIPDDNVICCLLDSIESATNDIDYMAPTLLALVTKYPGGEIERRAKKLFLSISQEMLDAYKLLL
jgi:hypothetical protein